MRLTRSAHKQAYELVGILHRNISVGNILIKPDGGGLLVDWDLPKPVDATGKSASERTVRRYSLSFSDGIWTGLI